MGEIDDFIDRWHDEKISGHLHEFLGMQWEEYVQWGANPDILPLIIIAHQENRRLSDIIDQRAKLTDSIKFPPNYKPNKNFTEHHEVQ